MTIKQIYSIKTLQRQGGVRTKQYQYLSIFILLSAIILTCGCSESGNEIIENKDGILTMEELAPYKDKHIEVNLTVTKLVKSEQTWTRATNEFYETSDPSVFLAVQVFYEGGGRIPPAIKTFNQPIYIRDGRVEAYEDEKIGQPPYYTIWVING